LQGVLDYIATYMLILVIVNEHKGNVLLEYKDLGTPLKVMIIKCTYDKMYRYDAVRCSSSNVTSAAL
jgi:hypothetical protein